MLRPSSSVLSLKSNLGAALLSLALSLVARTLSRGLQLCPSQYPVASLWLQGHFLLKVHCLRAILALVIDYRCFASPERWSSLSGAFNNRWR